MSLEMDYYTQFNNIMELPPEELMKRINTIYPNIRPKKFTQTREEALSNIESFPEDKMVKMISMINNEYENEENFPEIFKNKLLYAIMDIIRNKEMGKFFENNEKSLEFINQLPEPNKSKILERYNKYYDVLMEDKNKSWLSSYIYQITGKEEIKLIDIDNFITNN